MEEDIKILQDKDLLWKYPEKRILQAIENLINRNKELEEELEQKDMQHELELIGKEAYTKASMWEIIEQYYTANEDCIPKSVIKEEIEDYEDRMRYYIDEGIELDIQYYDYEERVKCLQELLEGSKEYVWLLR